MKGSVDLKVGTGKQGHPTGYLGRSLQWVWKYPRSRTFYGGDTYSDLSRQTGWCQRESGATGEVLRFPLGGRIYSEVRREIWTVSGVEGRVGEYS